ncbi:MAG: hypothetical protein JEZ12_25555 [Desulfobacterium sp.]|nr:hypothetical protein [Desulfobacterium sp.]
MKFYGYKNSKINYFTTDGGEWVRVSFLRWLFLKIFGFMTKIELKEA